MRRRLFDDEHELFRETARAFVEREIVPNDERWERDGIVDRTLWRRAGEAGLLSFEVPEAHGGLGVADFRYNAILVEEILRAGAAGSGLGLSIANDIVLPYFLRYADEAQQGRWLPGLGAGRLVPAIAMTEPGAGSDLAALATTARRDGDGYRLDGQKTFVSNGILADVVIVAARTGEPGDGHRGLSLLVVERGMPGFERGAKLPKLGLKAQDTAELFFDGVRVPAANRLGEEGRGFAMLMHELPRERLSVAVMAVAATETALGQTLDYVRRREAFGRPVGSFQHNRFALAEIATEATIARVFVDRCIEELDRGELSGEDAAMAKWWTTELQNRAVARCLQLHGGYGFTTEYPIARAWLDARGQTIYAGTNEIMKEIIGRSLDL